MTLSHLRTITERKRRVSRQYWNYESYYQHQYQMHLGRMIFVRITVYTCIKKKSELQLIWTVYYRVYWQKIWTDLFKEYFKKKKKKTVTDATGNIQK